MLSKVTGPDTRLQERRTEIWFLIGQLPVGGTERTLLDLARNLDQSRYAVTIWTIKDEGRLIKEVSEFVDYRSLKASGKSDVLAPLRFIREVRKQQPDIIQSFLYYDNLLARFTC